MAVPPRNSARRARSRPHHDSARFQPSLTGRAGGEGVTAIARPLKQQAR
jgi:hypothetical protein